MDGMTMLSCLPPPHDDEDEDAGSKSSLPPLTLRLSPALFSVGVDA
jgi:hypothetical protein